MGNKTIDNLYDAGKGHVFYPSEYETEEQKKAFLKRVFGMEDKE